MWEPVALCCFSRRTGCLVLGALELVAAIFGLVFGAYIITVGEIGIFNVICENIGQNMEDASENIERCEAIVRTTVETGTAITMFCAAVQLVCASMLIHGIRKNDHCLMCPFLIKNAILVVLKIISAGICILILFVVAFPLAILAGYCYGALIFMWSYFLLTVRAYYYELKRGKAVDHHRLIDQSDMEISRHRE